MPRRSEVPARAARPLMMNALWELLDQGALALDVEPPLHPLVARWVPLWRRSLEPASVAGSLISVVAGEGAGDPAPRGEPMLRLGTAAAWEGTPDGRVALHGERAGCTGRVDLSRGRAELRAPLAARPEDIAADLYGMLTISAALLAGRIGRALMHAAAVIEPGRGAWLLVGDARAGKSTTCATLMTAGWDFLSDDQLLLSADGAGGGRVEGWPRRFHLDEGWGSGRPSRERRDIDPARIGGGRWRRAAPLFGVLFPHVDAGAATRLEPLPPGEAFTRLVRQSPWLLADPESALPLTLLLQSVASRPAFGLRLGLDSYGVPERLLGCLQGAAESRA